MPAASGYTVTVADGQIVTGVDFGNQQLTPDAKGEFRGTIFNDLDGNGITNGNEYLQDISGRSLVVYLDQNQNGRRDSDEKFLTVSDDVDPDPASPTYNFTDLDPGTYTVALERASGWRQTTTGGIVNTPPLYAVGNGIGDNSSNLYQIDDYASSPQAVSVGETGVLLRDIAVDPISGRSLCDQQFGTVRSECRDRHRYLDRPNRCWIAYCPGMFARHALCHEVRQPDPLSH